MPHGPVEAARAWLGAKEGWRAEDYHIGVAEVQSCPAGYTSVDVTCLRMEDSEDPSDLLKRSRVLVAQEVNDASGEVETELAARDVARLKKMLQLEAVRVRTEEMQRELEEHAHKGGAAERDVTAEELLLEQDPEKRLEQLEAEIRRVRGVQSDIASSSAQEVDVEAAWGEDWVSKASGGGEATG